MKFIYSHIKSTLAVLALSLSISVNPAHAGDFEEGLAAHDKGDYSTAMKLLRPLAEKGDAAAQTGIGFMYNLGQGVEQDFKQAVIWFYKAALQGDANAQSALGLSYETGQGIAESLPDAIKWYQLAAEQGLPIAQYKLGTLYKSGQGLPQDIEKAYMWFSLAAPLHAEASQMRDELAAQMSPEQLAKAKQAAAGCKASAFKNCS